MKIPVQLDFLQANQTIAALEAREAFLASIPGSDPIVARAMADTLAAEFALRAAFRLDTEAQLNAANEAAVAEMVELKDAEFGESLVDAPLADWAPGEISEAYGR